MGIMASSLRLVACGLLATSLLPACGGGGGGGGSASVDPDATRIPADSSTPPETSMEPAETPTAQRARIPGILQRADSLVYSNIFGRRADGSSFHYEPSCSGPVCDFNEPSTGETLLTFRLEDLDLRVDRESEVLAKYSITLFRVNQNRTNVAGDLPDSDLLVSWMEHGMFAAILDSYSRGRGDFLYAGAGGDLSGTRPGGITGTWRGLMVGSPERGAFRGNKLQGDAALTYTGGARSSLDAAFTNIRNLDQNNANHSTTEVRFDGIEVSIDGTYKAGGLGNQIQGGFYGPQHEEAAGIFEQAGIVGAFGAKRQ